MVVWILLEWIYESGMAREACVCIVNNGYMAELIRNPLCCCSFDLCGGSTRVDSVVLYRGNDVGTPFSVNTVLHQDKYTLPLNQNVGLRERIFNFQVREVWENQFSFDKILVLKEFIIFMAVGFDEGKTVKINRQGKCALSCATLSL